MNGDEEYRPVFSFGVDDGELDGMTNAQCFTLGFELAKVWQFLEHDDEAFAFPVRVENAERIKRAIAHHKREGSVTFMANDRSESWLQLSVSARY